VLDCGIDWFITNMATGSTAWRDGWKINEQTLRKAPNWTILGRKDAIQTGMNRNGPHNSYTELKPSAEQGVIKSRNTWIQKHMRAKQWTPGPGAYKQSGDFFTKEDVDRQNTRERGPNYTFTKDIRETVFEVKNVQMRANNHNYPHKTCNYTRNKATRAYMQSPGAGEQLQYTTFGQGTWKK